MSGAGRAAAIAVLIAATLCAASAAGTGVAAAPAPDPYPRAAVAYRVLVNGEVLWERTAHAPLPPASLTKLMTALVLASAEGWDDDAVLVVSARAAAAGGSRLGLRAGERLRAGDAMTALLIGSANDACIALAEHAAGNVARFVARMNARAARSGLRDTHFVNPCGLDAPGHRSSIADLSTLARLAMAEPAIAWRVALDAAELQTEAGRALNVRTGNLLLGRVDGAVGIKSGFTSRAGKCLAALVRRGDDEVMVLLLNAPDRWWSATVLIEDAFDALDASRR